MEGICLNFWEGLGREREALDPILFMEPFMYTTLGL